MSNGLLADPQPGKRDADSERGMSEAQRPLAIDLYCGLGGWTEGFLSEGYAVIGFDIEARPYPGQLVLQDVLTIHGRQFKDAAIIVASPPCTEYSYIAMPWSRAKAKAAWYRAEAEFDGDFKSAERQGQLTALFNAGFHIQREACEAAGRYIPLVVENVKGAQPWVGPAKAHFGSFYLWGDVESVGGAIVAGGVRFGNTFRAASSRKVANKYACNGSWKNEHGADRHDPSNIASEGLKLPGNNTPRYWRDREVQRLCDAGGKGFAKRFEDTPMAWMSSKPSARKAASAQIAKIPFALSSHIARVFKPCAFSPIYQPEEKNLESRKEGI